MSIILSKLQYAHWGYAGICRQLHHLKAGHFTRILLSKAKTKFRKSANHLKACEFNYHMMPVCWNWSSTKSLEGGIHDKGPDETMRSWLLFFTLGASFVQGPKRPRMVFNFPKHPQGKLHKTYQYANRFPSGKAQEPSGKATERNERALERKKMDPWYYHIARMLCSLLGSGPEGDDVL